MIKAIIIEDESNSRELLQQMLENYIEGIELAGVAVDVSSGIELIRKTKPELVFLDVEMPGGTGFDILSAFEAPDFKVIFVTGYDHYAIKAIKFSALDYLLKPLSLNELRAAVAKMQKINGSIETNLALLKENIKKAPQEIDQIMLPRLKSHRIIKVNDILFVEAERSYVTFHLYDNQKYIASNPLNYYEELLSENHFYRIHKSYLVNCHKVLKLDAGRGGPVHMQNGAELPVAVRRKPAFIRFLDKIA